MVVVPVLLLVTVLVEVTVLSPVQLAGAVVIVVPTEELEDDSQLTQFGFISTVAGSAGIGMVTVSLKISVVASYANAVSVLKAVIAAGQLLVASGVFVVDETCGAQVDQPS